jgi:NADH-quinone oxidoreductase subunit L
MAGPTPVSALIHAATMVTSGLYLLARMSPVVLAAPGVMAAIAVVGALTAIVAATIAITQNDIKKILAYSTVSQLGYMFLASGVGAFSVAIFHVMTHAFFKGCLFLGSGSVIHAMHDVDHQIRHEDSSKAIDAQDVRTMGGLKRFMPSTRMTFLLSTFAIAGIPLFSGFFSKDEILFRAFDAMSHSGYATFAWIVGIVTAFLTAVYMMRGYMLTFEGEPRWPMADRIKPHESPWTMTLPLWILGVLAVIGGYVGLPAVFGHGEWNLIHHYLGAEYGGPVVEPVTETHVAVATEWMLLGLGALIAVAGVVLGWRWYARRGPEFDGVLARRFGPLYRLAGSKYYVDEAYEKVIVRPVIGGAERGFAPFDQYVIDGLVNFVAFFTRGVSFLLRYVQTGVVQTYAIAIVLGVVLVAALMLFG